MKRLLALAAALALAVLVVGILAGAPSAQTNPEGSAASSQELSEGDPLQDAKTYADKFGVDLEEAVRRLELHAPIGELDAELTEKEPGTFAGLWIRHEPEFRVIARFTRGGEQTIRPYVEGTPLAGIVEAQTASATLSELEAAQAEATRIVDGLGVPEESWVDVINNRVVLRVTDRARLEAALQEVGARLPDKVGVVEVDELLAPTANFYAGRKLYNSATYYCTSGFTVKDSSGRRGATTAGHCRDNLYFKGTYFPKRWGRFYQHWDVQWHNSRYYSDRPWARDYQGYRKIRHTRGRRNQSVGGLVCKFGQRTGYTCGRIRSKRYKPTNPSYNDPRATFILVYRDAGTIADTGDSGGPWYLTDIAYGIQSCGNGGKYACYMAINYVRDLGLRVVKAP